MIGNAGEMINPLNGNLDLRCDRMPAYSQPICTYSLSTEQPSLSVQQTNLQAVPQLVSQSHSMQTTIVPTPNHATATANDPCSQIAHVLQCYQQGGEDAEFVRKAIESLVKKLKDKRIELENLITAVTSGGKQPTSCVTIQRSLDGRLQVAGRKGVPHVVYARIWRWPNVNKNELQKLPICTVSSDNQDVICINPYHYERILYSNINLNLALEHWCSITYYEFDTQVGETFKVRVFVDGGVNPSATQDGRFCLGALPNVHRDAPSEKTRLHIGKGVRISTQRDGSVYLECLSHQSVYVRSYYLDYEHNSEYGMVVYKFCSGLFKIFDLRWAYAEMEQQSNSARLAVAAQAAAVAGIVSPAALTPSLIEHAGTGVDDLRKVCCTIGISFVKGWGPGYKRTSIKETPCWIEIQLHRPLQLLDQLLKKNNDYYSCE
uniref:Mothers against decapentaplegic homolog n=1 Tax=Syphacia muris TaxID=451379 RepID=A0A0N5ANC1_9BILA